MKPDRGGREPGDGGLEARPEEPQRQKNDVAIEFLYNLQLTWKGRWGRGETQWLGMRGKEGERRVAPAGSRGGAPSTWAGPGGGLWCGLSGEGPGRRGCGLPGVGEASPW